MEIAGTALDINGFPSQIYAEEMVVDYGDDIPTKPKKKSGPVTIYRLIKREDAEAMGISLEEGSVSTPNGNTKVITRQIIKLDKNSPLMKREKKSGKAEEKVEDAVSADKFDAMAMSFDSDEMEYEAQMFSCNSCPKQFRHLSHLKRHVNIHSGERLYPCEHCGKSFLDASTLLRHRRTHTGERPHACPKCSKAFGTLGSLRRHETVHNPEVRRFVCEECLKRFPDNSSYQKHLSIHAGVKPHVCDICDKRFYHVGDLNGHRKIHEEVKPHSCTHCHRQFAKYSNFARHLLIHEGGKQYACHICSVSYNFQSSLTRHLLTHAKRIGSGTSRKAMMLAGEDCVDKTKLTLRTIRHLLNENQIKVDEDSWDEVAGDLSDEEEEGWEDVEPERYVGRVTFRDETMFEDEEEAFEDSGEGYEGVEEAQRYEEVVRGEYEQFTAEDGIVYEVVEEAYEVLDNEDGELVVS